MLDSMGAWKSLIVVPVVFVCAAVGLSVLLFITGDAVPAAATATVTGFSITLTVATVLASRSARLFFWVQRVKALNGSSRAPAWDVDINLLSRLDYTAMPTVADALKQRNRRVDPDGPRRLIAHFGDVPVSIEWMDHVGDSHDWRVMVQLRYPSVPFTETSTFLSGTLKTLEALEESLQVFERRLQLSVTYKAGQNPFEGILIRSAPVASVAAYSVTLSPEGGESGTVVLNRTSVIVSSKSLVTFQRVVEGVLTLGGKWPGSVVDALR